MKKGKNIRIGVIGLGAIGPSHVFAVHRTKGADLAAICDVRPEAAEAAGRKYGVPAFTSVRAMLEADVIDAATIATPMAYPYSTVTPVDWAAVLFLGIFQIGVAYACLVRGIARVPALEASLILIAEPVLSPFWAWLVHGEAPTVWAMIGGVLILGVTAMMTLARRSEQ